MLSIFGSMKRGGNFEELSAEKSIVIHFYTTVHYHINPLAAGKFGCGFIDYSLLHPYSSGKRIQFDNLFNDLQYILRFSEDIDNINRMRN
jgi:hypothetical protein